MVTRLVDEVSPLLIAERTHRAACRLATGERLASVWTSLSFDQRRQSVIGYYLITQEHPPWLRKDRATVVPLSLDKAERDIVHALESKQTIFARSHRHGD